MRSEHAYKLARAMYEAHNKRIINLTPNTKEQVFEHGSLNDW
jgi:hypothetical protein